MAKLLAVWLHGTKVATVEEDRRRRLHLRYTNDAKERFQLGTPLLSLTLPLNDQQFGNGVVRPFLDGLLPEGDPRRAIADDLSLRADDTFGLISALGRDCAGALVIQPYDHLPPPVPTTATAEPLDEETLAELVANLRNAPLGAGDRVRISLAGVQEKLLLTRRTDGGWGRPIEGTPSTHILKPEIRGYPHSVENEAFCMRLALNLGLPAAEVKTTKVVSRQLIVVTRFDRIVDSAGVVERVHQEDFCQATGTPPSRKYQEDGGPSLRRLAAILQSVDPASLEGLLRMVAVHVVVGNGDAHAKNFSLLHESSGAIRLAPMYDLMSTLVYGDDRLAMCIDDVRRTDRVSAARIINEATSWGMPRHRAVDIVEHLLDAIPNAADQAAADTPGLPSNVREVVADQLNTLRSKSA